MRCTHDAGIRFDLGPGSPPEVAAAALAALQGLPPHRFAEALAASGADIGKSYQRTSRCGAALGLIAGQGEELGRQQVPALWLGI